MNDGWRKVHRVLAQEGRFFTLLLECGHTRYEIWRGRMMRLCTKCRDGENSIPFGPIDNFCDESKKAVTLILLLALLVLNSCVPKEVRQWDEAHAEASHAAAQ